MTPLRVAIVDDEMPARQVLRKYLSAEPGVEIVAESANGFEAVKAVAEKTPDLLLLDVHMPKLDGFEVLELVGRETAALRRSLLKTRFGVIARHSLRRDVRRAGPKTDTKIGPQVRFVREISATSCSAVTELAKYHFLHAQSRIGLGAAEPVSARIDALEKCVNGFVRPDGHCVSDLQGVLQLMGDDAISRSRSSQASTTIQR